MFTRIILFVGFVALPMGSILADPVQDHYPGRFFTTPEQRNTIDSIRYSIEPETVPIPLPDPKNNKPDTKANTNIGPVRFKGYIRSSNGETVYWVNDKNSMESAFDMQNYNLRNMKSAPDILRLRLREGEIIQLEAGESYVPNESESELDTTSHEINW